MSTATHLLKTYNASGEIEYFIRVIELNGLNDFLAQEILVHCDNRDSILIREQDNKKFTVNVNKLLTLTKNDMGIIIEDSDLYDGLFYLCSNIFLIKNQLCAYGFYFKNDLSGSITPFFHISPQKITGEKSFNNFFNEKYNAIASHVINIK